MDYVTLFMIKLDLHHLHYGRITKTTICLFKSFYLIHTFFVVDVVEENHLYNVKYNLRQSLWNARKSSALDEWPHSATIRLKIGDHTRPSHSTAISSPGMATRGTRDTLSRTAIS